LGHVHYDFVFGRLAQVFFWTELNTALPKFAIRSLVWQAGGRNIVSLGENSVVPIFGSHAHA